MYYIGWDIGIKNLAYCIIEKTEEKEVIKELKIINLIDDAIIHKCNQINKNGNKELILKNDTEVILFIKIYKNIFLDDNFKHKIRNSYLFINSNMV